MNPFGKHVASGCPGGRVPEAECQPRGSHCSLMARRSVHPRWGEGTSLYLGVCLPARHIATVSRRQECRHIQLIRTSGFSPSFPFPGSPGFQEERLPRTVPPRRWLCPSFPAGAVVLTDSQRKLAHGCSPGARSGRTQRRGCILYLCLPGCWIQALADQHSNQSSF